MVSRVLFSGQLTFPAKPPREAPIAPLTPSRNVLSFSLRSSVDRFAMRIVKAASFTRTVAKVDEEAISRKKLAVFVSGGGSNFKKIHEGCLGGSVQGDLVLLVTNKKGFFFLLLHIVKFGFVKFWLLQYRLWRC